VIDPGHPRRRVAAVFLLAAALALASLPLAWHQREVPGPLVILRIASGFDVAGWLVAVAVICALLGARFFFRFPGFYSKWAVIILALATTAGIFADYIDAESRAAQMNSNTTAYNGPGFYLAAVLVPVMIAAAILVWRTADPL
jgi:hypothetical protein